MWHNVIQHKITTKKPTAQISVSIETNELKCMFGVATSCCRFESLKCNDVVANDKEAHFAKYTHESVVESFLFVLNII